MLRSLLLSLLLCKCKVSHHLSRPWPPLPLNIKDRVWFSRDSASTQGLQWTLSYGHTPFKCKALTLGSFLIRPWSKTFRIKNSWGQNLVTSWSINYVPQWKYNHLNGYLLCTVPMKMSSLGVRHRSSMKEPLLWCLEIFCSSHLINV